MLAPRLPATGPLQMLSPLLEALFSLFTYLTDPTSSFKGQFLKKPTQLLDPVKSSQSGL